MAASLLSIERLTLERGGVRLLHNFQLEVAAGDLVWVEGANGSGKTSLLRYLAGLSPSTGSGVLRRGGEKIFYLGHKPAIKTALTPRGKLPWDCRGAGGGAGGVESS
ncbi:MAG: ATP-binding cassette domain-containing protein, partial [Halieaceae bacterium]|nr:ATP-binding cassette domain-containing protein [Halieaceae bacterium]